MNRFPSDFALLKGKVLHQNDDEDLPIIGKMPDYIRIYMWFVLYPEGLLYSWDRTYIDSVCYDFVCRGVSHEFFSHVFLMSLDNFKLKFPNVPISDSCQKSEP